MGLGGVLKQDKPVQTQEYAVPNFDKKCVKLHYVNSLAEFKDSQTSITHIQLIENPVKYYSS